jgi:hypothetical protein
MTLALRLCVLLLALTVLLALLGLATQRETACEFLTAMGVHHDGCDWIE